MIAFFESPFSTIEASEAGCWEKHKKEEKQNKRKRQTDKTTYLKITKMLKKQHIKNKIK